MEGYKITYSDAILLWGSFCPDGLAQGCGMLNGSEVGSPNSLGIPDTWLSVPLEGAVCDARR